MAELNTTRDAASEHKCITIKPSKKAVNILSSSQINKSRLIDPDVIIREYPNYQTVSKIGTLAQRLAQESYFGYDVLEKCTVMGCRDSSALPIKELNDLKQKIFFLYFHSSGTMQLNLKVFG